MRQVLPHPVEVDVLESYLAAPRLDPGGRPWVVVGMVSSLDGATAVAGRSGDLGGPADREVFRAVRALADVVLVAGGTARAEGYGPIRLSDAASDARVAAGRSAQPPRLAVVSTSLELDAARLAGDGPPPLVLTTEDCDPQARGRLEDHAEVRAAGQGTVDMAAALASLRDDGARLVVCEGGPTLNAALVEADLVDEWCVTLAPAVVGGHSHRLVHGAAEVAGRGALALAQLLEADGTLFGRWIRPQPGGPVAAGPPGAWSRRISRSKSEMVSKPL